MPSIIAVVEPDKLAKLTTKQLLFLRDRLLRCEDSLAKSDVEPAAVSSEIEPATIRFKDDARWTKLYNAVKAELSTREHVPKRKELREQLLQRRRSQTRRSRKSASPARRRSSSQWPLPTSLTVRLRCAGRTAVRSAEPCCAASVPRALHRLRSSPWREACRA